MIFLETEADSLVSIYSLVFSMVCVALIILLRFDFKKKVKEDGSDDGYELDFETLNKDTIEDFNNEVDDKLKDFDEYRQNH